MSQLISSKCLKQLEKLIELAAANYVDIEIRENVIKLASKLNDKLKTNGYCNEIEHMENKLKMALLKITEFKINIEIDKYNTKHEVHVLLYDESINNIERLIQQIIFESNNENPDENILKSYAKEIIDLLSFVSESMDEINNLLLSLVNFLKDKKEQYEEFNDAYTYMYDKYMLHSETLNKFKEDMEMKIASLRGILPEN